MQILNVDRDFNDIGVAKFTVKYFVVKNGLPSAKSREVLAAWNPPKEWGRLTPAMAGSAIHLCCLFCSVLDCVLSFV